MSRHVLLVGGSALALALAGCGTKTLNSKSAVDLVNKGLAQSSAGPAKSVNCPSGVEAKAGKTFDCHATLANGRTATFTLRIDSVSGDSGHLTIVGAKQP